MHSSRDTTTLIFFLFAFICVSVMAQVPPQQRQVNTGGLSCAFCEFVLLLIEGYITEGSTEQQIATIVSEICNYVPQNYTQLCKEFVQTYGPTIIQYLFEKQTPQAICTEIDLCSSVSTNNNPWCNVCVSINQAIASENNIGDDWISGVCATFTNNQRSLCQQLVKRFADVLERGQALDCSKICQ